MTRSAAGSAAAVAPFEVTVSGFTIPFITCGLPSGDGTQHTSM